MNMNATTNSSTEISRPIVKGLMFNLGKPKDFKRLEEFFQAKAQRTQKYRKPIVAQPTIEKVEAEGQDYTTWMTLIQWQIGKWAEDRGRTDEARRLAIVLNLIDIYNYAEKNAKWTFEKGREAVTITIPPFVPPTLESRT